MEVLPIKFEGVRTLLCTFGFNPTLLCVWVVKDETSFPFGTLQEKRGGDEYIGDCVYGWGGGREDRIVRELDEI